MGNCPSGDTGSLLGLEVELEDTVAALEAELGAAVGDDEEQLVTSIATARIELISTNTFFFIFSSSIFLCLTVHT